jgi:hypothetical protein
MYIIENPDIDGYVPQEYQKAKRSIDGAEIDVYNFVDEALKDFFIVKCYVGGTRAYYCFDSAEGTIQRATQFDLAVQAANTEPDQSENTVKFAWFTNMNKTGKAVFLIILFIAIVLIAVAVLVIVKISSMKDEFNSALKNEEGDGRERSLAVATGHAAYGFISECAEKVMAKFPNIHINVYEIRNDFFGESVTVAGLVTGVDLIAQLTGKELYGKLLLPTTMLRHGGDLFLCGTSRDELAEKLGAEIILSENDGYEFLDKLIGNEW